MFNSDSSKNGASRRGILSAMGTHIRVWLSPSAYPQEYAAEQQSSSTLNFGTSPVLNLDEGPVHLAVEAGIGGTSFCLSLAAAVLEANGRVVWLGREMPDGQRTAAILNSLSESQLEKLFVIQFGQDLLTRVRATKPLISRLSTTDLVVIDDWCGSVGRAAADDTAAMRQIIAAAKDCRLIFTSKAYESPTGIDEPWRARGGAEFSGGVINLAWLFQSQRLGNRRELRTGDQCTELVLTEKGFFPA